MVDVINLSFKNKIKYKSDITSSEFMDKMIPIKTRDIDRKIINIYQFNLKQTLKQGSYFGESNNENNAKCTIITSSDCKMLYITNDKLMGCIRDATFKVKRSHVNLILSSTIFDLLNANTKSSLQKYIASIISTRLVEKGEFVIKQGEVIKHLYFIRNGRYEVNINKSVIEVNELIKYFGGSVENDKTHYELLFENKKIFNFLHQKKLSKVK